MKKLIAFACLAVAAPSAASAAIVNCTVTSGTVLTAASGGIAYTIANATGTSTGGATGLISCPNVTVGSGLQVLNYKVLAQVDYQNGPFGTTSGTTVRETLSLVGGALNGSSVAALISGGASSSTFNPANPFQIGATLGGLNSYGAFTVNVDSAVTTGGPVAGSSGQVVVSYDVGAVPEPASWALMIAGFGIVGGALRSTRKSQQLLAA